MACTEWIMQGHRCEGPPLNSRARSANAAVRCRPDAMLTQPATYPFLRGYTAPGLSRSRTFTEREALRHPHHPIVPRRPLTSYSYGELASSVRLTPRLSKSARGQTASSAAMVMPRSHVSIARFYDWSEETNERFSVSKLYRDIAHAPKVYPSEKGPPRQMNWCTNGVRVTPGRMFGRDKGALTKGEREIIEGICRNRGDLPRDASNRPELTARSHKEAWLVGKQIARPVFRLERADAALHDSFFIRSVDAANSPARPPCHLCELGVPHDRPLAIKSLENGVEHSIAPSRELQGQSHCDATTASPLPAVTSEQALTPELTAWRQERSKTFLTESSDQTALTREASAETGLGNPAENTPGNPPTTPWTPSATPAPPSTPDPKLLPRRPALPNHVPGAKGRGSVIFKNALVGGEVQLSSQVDLREEGRETRVKDGKKKVTVNIYLPKMASEPTEEDLRHCLLQGKPALRKERPLSHSDFKARQRKVFLGLGEPLREGCDTPCGHVSLPASLPEKTSPPLAQRPSPRQGSLDPPVVTAVMPGGE